MLLTHSWQAGVFHAKVFLKFLQIVSLVLIFASQGIRENAEHERGPLDQWEGRSIWAQMLSLSASVCLLVPRGIACLGLHFKSRRSPGTCFQW